MRVRAVTAGPLFPDDGPLGARLLRRGGGITLEVSIFVLLTVLLPLLLVGAAIVDLALWLGRRKPWVGVRLVCMLWWFLFGEMRGLVGILGIWLFTGGPFGLGSLRRRRWVYDLRLHWARSHIGGARVLFGLKFEIEGVELAGPGPEIVLIRHASIIDNMLPDAVVVKNTGIGLRFVLKRELQVIPTLDICGRWIPTNFIRRGSQNPQGEIAALRRLAHDLGEGEGILVYPEGTRFTPKKLARAQEIVAERQPELAPLAAKLENILPPRLGGPLALLDETAGHADVVVFGHVGFDGFEYISDIWKGGLVGRRIRMKFWRFPAAEIPQDEQGRTAWLYDVWLALDEWVGANKEPV